MKKKKDPVKIEKKKDPVKMDINSNTNYELQLFKTAGIQLLSGKLFCDYIQVNNNFTIEPESFFEEWINRGSKLDDETVTNVWRYFMSNLIAFRKFKKLL